MILIDDNLLDYTCQEAEKSPRLRMNYNFHKNLDDPVNRLLNAMQPETYIPAHRHLNPPKQEICLVLKGKIELFLFDDNGNITQKTTVGPKVGIYGFEIEPGMWHSLKVMEPDTVLYEIKQGPYSPIAPSDIAPWNK